ncbi:MAG: crossover junction endodeoxyribonuclease RuvC [Candidatus Acidiferrales bacterium]|jgi:crossover junction endodeoxyribonuclease RuvC
MHRTPVPRSKTISRGLRVLGVDPALAGATGYGIIEFVGSTPSLIRFGSFKLPARATLAARLYEIHSLIAQLVAEFTPDAVAVESVFTALNVKTALKLAEVRGVVLLAAAQASVPAHSYSPREVKCSVAGYGAASKLQMQQMVTSALGLKEIPEPADAADALAVALCHAHLARARGRMQIAMAVTPGTIASPGKIRAAQIRSRNQVRAAHVFQP